MSENIGNLTAHIGADTAGLTAAEIKMRKFGVVGQSSFAAVNKSATMLKSTLLGLGAMVGAGSIGMLAASAIKTAASFEKTMAVVKGVSRSTGQEFIKLTNIAKELGEKTEWTANQAAEGLQFLSMAGFEASQSIKAIPGVLDLATAGNIDLARAADVATNALTAMRMPVEELGKVNDVFIGTITRTNTNMEMMAESFKYAAPVANAFGYSIEELSSMIGMLGNAGIQGSMAGTQLAFAIQKADKVATDMGFSSHKLIDVLAELKNQGASNAEMMQLFGMRGGRATLVLKEMVPQVEELAEKLRNSQGETKQLADTMRDTLTGAWAELQSAIQSVAIDAFALYETELKDMMQKTTQYIRDNKEVWLAFGNVITMVLQGIATLVKTSPLLNFIAGISKLKKAVKGLREETIESLEAEKAWIMYDSYRQTRYKTELEAINKKIVALKKLKESTYGIGFDLDQITFGGFGEYDYEGLIKKDTENYQKLLEEWNTVTEGVTEADKNFWESWATDIIAKTAEAEEKVLAKYKEEMDAWNQITEDFVSAERSADERWTASRIKALKEMEAERNNYEMIMDVSGPDAEDNAIALLTKQVEEGVKETLEGVLEAENEASRGMIDLSQRTADAMEQNFSDFFFDVMIGNFKSLEDVGKGVLRSLQRATADYLGQLMKIGIFGKEGEGGSWLKVGLTAIKAIGAIGGGGGGLSDATAAGTSPALDGLAKGGVVNTPTMFPVPGVYSQPTIFPMASGMGLMAEAGPEAVMPLTRLSNGDLGVESSEKSDETKAPMINIFANDAQSFIEMAHRNPSAIIGPIIEGIQQGGQLRDTIRGIM